MNTEDIKKIIYIMRNLLIINFKVRLNKGIEKLFWKIGFDPSSNQLVIQKQRYVLA